MAKKRKVSTAAGDENDPPVHKKPRKNASAATTPKPAGTRKPAQKAAPQAKAKAAKSKAVKPRKPTLPPIKWDADDGHLTWLLITLMERRDNSPALVGIKKKGQKINGENKTHAFRRIALEMFPEQCKIDHGKVANRIKMKIQRLTKKYKHQSKRLRVTGGGINSKGNDDAEDEEDEEDEEDNEDEDDEEDEDEDEEDKDQEENGGEFEDGSPDVHMKFYIPATGPDADTPDQAKNLWKNIVKKFKFFPRLHILFASKANVTPPAVTTGVGPHGRQTFYYQKLDDTTPSRPENSAVQSAASNAPEPLQNHNRSSGGGDGVTDGWGDSFVAPEQQASIQAQYATLQELLTAAQASQPIPQPGPVSDGAQTFGADDLQPFTDFNNDDDDLPEGMFDKDGVLPPRQPSVPPQRQPSVAPQRQPSAAPQQPPPVAAVIPATPASRKTGFGQELFEKAKQQITPRAQKPSFEEGILQLSREHLAEARITSNKKLKLETMSVFNDRRKQIFERLDRRLLNNDKAQQLLDAIDEEEKEELASMA